MNRLNLEPVGNKIIEFLLIFLLITLSWIGLEYILDGNIISQKSDNVIAIILTWLIMNRRK